MHDTGTCITRMEQKNHLVTIHEQNQAPLTRAKIKTRLHNHRTGLSPCYSIMEQERHPGTQAYNKHHQARQAWNRNITCNTDINSNITLEYRHKLDGVAPFMTHPPPRVLSERQNKIRSKFWTRKNTYYPILFLFFLHF